MPIACGQHMDSPGTVARFLSLLEPYIQPGAKVLDLGAGEMDTGSHHMAA